MDLLEALRHLTSFSPPRRLAPPVPWPLVADVAAFQGVAPIVAYNLEYRMGGGGAPEEVRDRMLGVYQGSLSDNVFKLVNLKRLLDETETVNALLIEAAAYSDALYPHVAFRPVPEVKMFVRREDIPLLTAGGKPLGFRPAPEEDGAVVLTDGRTRFLLFASLFPNQSETLVDDMLARGIPAKAFGTGARRPSIEDAVLTHVALMAREGFDVPLLEFVDLRELVQGSPSQQGTWKAPPDPSLIKARAEALGVSRALYAAMLVLLRFFPEVEPQARALLPDVSLPVRTLLEKAVVDPTLNLERTNVTRAGEQIRKLLTGG